MLSLQGTQRREESPMSAAPATERQVSYLTTLLNDRVFDTNKRDEALAKIRLGDLDKSTASSLIDSLLRAPKVRAAAPRVELSEGMYMHDGKVYRVKRSEAGHLYASELVGRKFQFARGMMRVIQPEDRMTLEQAKAYGVEYGICCVCGRLLTNEVSVAEGIGPICSGRL